MYRLSSLYNSLPESTPYETRSHILLSLFSLAVSRDDLSVLSSALESLPTWVSREWGISDSSVADKILLSFVEAIEQGSSEGRYQAIQSLLLAYTNENTDEALKRKLVLYSLASDDIFDIESLTPLASDDPLAKLMDIFVRGSSSDLSGVSNNLPPPLNAEKLKEKLQYILLADYCSNKVGQTVTYDEVAQILGLQEGGDGEEKAMEVEAWIIASTHVPFRPKLYFY